MKHLSFEDFLMDYHCRTHSEVLDDDLPEAYGDWLENLDSDEWISLGDRYLKDQIDATNIDKVTYTIAKSRPLKCEVEEKLNENVEKCSECGIEWKKIGKSCPVCFAPAEKKLV